MRIAICDDNHIDREIIAMMLRDYAACKTVHFDIIEYKCGNKLFYDIEDGRIFDIVFLDIYMDEISGIDVAHKLREVINYDGKIIFLTATPRFAVDSYEVNASGYLVKPIYPDKVNALMDKILLFYNVKTYAVRQHAGIVHIPIDEILYIESDNNKCTIHRKGDRCYTIYKRLDEIQNEISSTHFLRCHQSYLVNMDCIQRADKEFELINGESISIRQRDLKSIRSAYLEYLAKK